MIRILHSADLHLTNRQSIAGRFFMVNGMSLALADKAVALAEIVRYDEENEIDLAVVAGDIFMHGNTDDLSDNLAHRFMDKLCDQSPVVVCSGNHDRKAAERVSALGSFTDIMRRFGLYVYERPDILPLFIKGQLVKIFILPYPRTHALNLDPKFKGMSPEEKNIYVGRQMEAILSGFHAEIDKEALNILVGHFAVGGSSYAQDQEIPPFDVYVQKDYLDKFDLVLLGHLHEPQPYYCGAIDRRGFGEAEMQPGFKIYEVENRKVEEIFIPLPARTYLTFTPTEFLNGNHYDLEACIRVKGRALRPEYDAVIRKARSLELQFFKNAMEVQLEAQGDPGTEGVSEEPTLEQAIGLWASGREGVGRFLGKLVEKGKEIEAEYAGR